MCRQVDVGKFSVRCLRKFPMSTPASLQCQHKLLCKTSIRKKFQSTFVCVLVWEKNIDIGEFLDVFDWTLFVVVMSWEGSCAWTTHQDPSIVWKRARLELLTLLCDIFSRNCSRFYSSHIPQAYCETLEETNHRLQRELQDKQREILSLRRILEDRELQICRLEKTKK